jgi:hypothetical protein
MPAIVRYQQWIRLLEQTKPLSEWTDEEELIQRIQTDPIMRRLVSLIMLKKSEFRATFEWVERLERIWPRLVQLPAHDTRQYSFDISVIMPAYKEDGRRLLARLQRAHDLADDPSKMEIIVVNAGHCTDLQAVTSSKTLGFGKLTCVEGTGGGRGPGLNQGASSATGRILTFLHADTRLTKGWNVAIVQAFQRNPKANSCAFSFAIDTSPLGLNGGPYPPGIRAIERTANWRTHWFHLPYGDQCLSLPRHVYDHVGGFPHQCLMEDYELVRLLRQRVADLGEELAILDMTAYCSPRRWQSLGVLYVTYTNSKCVNLYSRGDITPDDLFQVYYGAPLNGNSNGNGTRKSPWEEELERRLQD